MSLFGFTKKGQLLKVAAPGAFFKIVVAVCITPRDHNSPFRELEARWICFSKPFKTDFWPGYKSLVGRTIADNPKENNAHIAIKMDSKLFKTRGVCMKVKAERERIGFPILSYIALSTICLFGNYQNRAFCSNQGKMVIVRISVKKSIF